MLIFTHGAVRARRAIMSERSLGRRGVYRDHCGSDHISWIDDRAAPLRVRELVCRDNGKIENQDRRQHEQGDLAGHMIGTEAA